VLFLYRKRKSSHLTFQGGGDGNWVEAERNILQLVTFFLFAFVGALILIGLTNVISTISENVKNRSKEFAVLQSIGMTNDGISKMLNLETVFASVRSVLFGVPLGIYGSYLIQVQMTNVVVSNFYIPWLWLIISIITVFIVTWITVRFASSKLKKQNIIETIRNGSGM